METDLYIPVKRHLEALGFEVKGEVRGCDLVALSGSEPEIVVIGELKRTAVSPVSHPAETRVLG